MNKHFAALVVIGLSPLQALGLGPVEIEADFHYGTSDFDFPLGLGLTNHSNRLRFWAAHVGPLSLPGPNGTFITAPGGTNIIQDAQAFLAEWEIGADHVRWAFQTTGSGHHPPGQIVARPGGFVGLFTPKGPTTLSPMAAGATQPNTFETTLQPPWSTDPGAPTFDPFIGWFNNQGELEHYDVASGGLSTFAVDGTPTADGGFCLVGTVRGELTFYPGTANEHPLYQSPTVYDSFDIYMVRYDANRNILWSRRHGGGDNAQPVPDEDDAGASIVALPDGSLVAWGSTKGEMRVNMGRPDEMLLQARPEQDIFMGRWSDNGDLLWARVFSSVGFDRPGQVSVLPNGDLIAVGAFSNTLTLPGVSGPINITSIGGTDCFVMRLRGSDGAVMWATPFGSTADFDLLWSCTVAPDGSWVAAGGEVYGNLFYQGQLRLVSRGGADGVLAVLDTATGSPLLFHSIGSNNFDTIYRVLALDNDRVALHAMVSAGAVFDFAPARVYPGLGSTDALLAVLRLRESALAAESWRLY